VSILLKFDAVDCIPTNKMFKFAFNAVWEDTSIAGSKKFNVSILCPPCILQYICRPNCISKHNYFIRVLQ